MKNAQYYVKVFCDYFEANMRNIEIALEAPHMMGKLVDFQGDLPGGSGFFHDTLIPKIDKMKHIPDRYKLACRLFKLLTWNQQYCVFMWEYYIHRRVTSGKREVYLASGKDVAEFLRLDYECFKKARQAAMDRINNEICNSLH